MKKNMFISSRIGSVRVGSCKTKEYQAKIYIIINNTSNVDINIFKMSPYGFLLLKFIQASFRATFLSKLFSI
ncbi:hypothetical protein HanIR_Chr02g0056881 [Helianthus annuus]|nr:hypothetical protein HanIR_Chr02g0056881 [Helianthus annuus]